MENKNHFAREGGRFTHGSLFSGISRGGFDLAAEWMGWENIFHCEWNPFGRHVLNHYWPEAESFEDITKTDFTKYANSIDIISGGFPCQPFSTSGEQLGELDERYLFDEMLRAIEEIQPRWVVAENVYGITSPKFEKVFEFICSSLENQGYQVQPYIIPATAVEADHERNRVWFVAYSERPRLQGSRNLLGSMQPAKIGNRKTSRFVDFIQRNSMPFLCSSHYGLPRKLAEQAVHGAGNAIVPQLAYEIFKSIEQYEEIIS